MLYLYNPKNKNKRWSFPTLHIAHEGWERSICGKVSINNPNLKVSTEPPKTLYTVCEKCVYGRVNLREKLYEED